MSHTIPTMVQAKPLSYENLKTVMTYLEANQRILLTRCVPSLKTFEKEVPFRIDRLQLVPLGIVLNDTRYQWGIIREYPPGVDAHPHHQKENDDGGIEVDLDEFGFLISRTEALTPGDLDLRAESDSEDNDDMDEQQYQDRKQQLQRQLELYERALARRRELDDFEQKAVVGLVVKQLVDTVEGTIPTEIEQYQALNYKVPIIPLVVNRMSQRYKDLKRETRGVVEHITYEEEFFEDLVSSKETLVSKLHCQTMVMNYHNRRNKIRPPWTPILQLSIRRENQVSPRFERYSYNFRFHEALKNLTTKILGGRSEPIRVGHLVIQRSLDVPRLPANLKIKTKSLSVACECLAKICSHIIERSSFPLKKLRLMATSMDQGEFILSNKTIKNAEILKIDNFPSEIDPWTWVFATMTNKSVELKHEDRNLTYEDFLALVENWIQQERPIDTTYSFGIESKKTCKRFLRNLAKRDDAFRVDRHTVILFMSDELHLSVSSRKRKIVVDPFDEDYFGIGPQYVLTMRVEIAQI